jgi:hypothetical protein
MEIIVIRRTTPAENLRMIRARLSEHLSPAEVVELEEAAEYLATAEEALNSVSYEKPITAEEIDRMINVTRKYGYAIRVSRFVAWLEAIKRDFNGCQPQPCAAKENK